MMAFLWATVPNLSAQGTAISYQGRLNVSGSPANTNYDFRFAVYDAVTNGTRVSLLLTNFTVPVSNGLFSVNLDFGASVFNGTDNGSNYFMDIGVRAIGVAAFTVLSPRQPILPVPYAIFATSASNLLGSLQSTQLVGTISSSLISGTYSGSVSFPNAANNFSGNFSGTFSGNGSSLTALNGTQVTSGTVADLRLSPNVALLNQNQTFTGANKFTGTGTYPGVNTFTNNANYFVGNFFGNGLVGWLAVTGTATNAMRDAGYLLLNAGLATVTLPASGTLSPGDIVRISGGGAGGWLVKENTSQSILGNFASYRNSYLLPLTNSTLTAPNGNFHDVAASADGVCMYAVGNFQNFYTSTDSGHTWNPGVNAGSWYSVACSANGKIVYLAPSSSGTIQKSNNGGLTWATTAYTGTSVACSSDGTQVFTASSGSVVCSGNGNYLAKLSGGAISVSVNSGSTFNTITGPSGGTVTCLAVSSDCTRLVAGVYGGLLYASANQGATWTTLTTANQYWSGAWMSADGSRFAATTSLNASAGGVFYSSIIPQPNTISTYPNTIGGSQGSAVELQYIGNNQFVPASSTGLIWAN